MILRNSFNNSIYRIHQVWPVAEKASVVLITILQLPLMQHSQFNTNLLILLPVEMALLSSVRRPDTMRAKHTPNIQFGTNLVNGEHVEVGDVVFLGVLDPRPALLLVDQLSDVLVHKLTLFEKCHIRPA